MNDKAVQFLPTDKPIVCYDGYCGLCDRLIKFLIRADKNKVLRFTHLHNPAILQALKDAKINPEVISDSVILYVNGNIFMKSAAVLKIFGYIGFPYRLLTIFRLVPTSISNFIYDKVARNRYRIFGKRDSCDLPGTMDKDVFL